MFYTIKLELIKQIFFPFSKNYNFILRIFHSYFNKIENINIRNKVGK